MVEDGNASKSVIDSCYDDMNEENMGNGTESNEENDDGLVDYKEKYRNLKRKLKCLLYEQECFHDELRKVQRKCLRVNRDKSFLLDRLLQYEQPEVSSSDDEITASSSDNEEKDNTKKQNAVKSKTSGKSSTKGTFSKASADGPSKSVLNAIAGDKIRCRRTENGKQCPKLVGIKVKSGICYAHRQQMSAERQNQSTKTSTSSLSSVKSPQGKPTTTLPVKEQTGGKDIGQIKEAMEASSHLASSSPGIYADEDDELVIDLPH